MKIFQSLILSTIYRIAELFIMNFYPEQKSILMKKEFTQELNNNLTFDELIHTILYITDS